MGCNSFDAGGKGLGVIQARCRLGSGAFEDPGADEGLQSLLWYVVRNARNW